MPIFAIVARWTPEVLSRIVLLLHRRRVQIDSLAAEHDRESDVLRIEVKVEENEARARLLEANLYNLIDVLVVDTRTDDRGAEFCADEERATEDGFRKS